MSDPAPCIVKRYYNAVLDKLREDVVKFCSKFADTPVRIRHVFAFCEEVKIDLFTTEFKSLERAEALKVRGNDLFLKQHSNAQAVTVYNEALKVCPQDKPEGKQLYAVLVANRCAVFLDDCEYKKVLQDVAFLKQYGHHPNPEKISTRGRKALQALRRSVGSKLIRLNEDGTVKSPTREESSWSSGNPQYPALSSKLTVKKDDVMGRHVVATEDIKTGEIIAMEQPYVSVVTRKDNCENCAISTDQIHVCPKCHAVYCSIPCLENARVHHQYECGITPLFDSETPECVPLMALRMITQRPRAQVLKDKAYASVDREVDVYKTDDYYNVSRLERHENLQGVAVLLEMTFYAVFLLKILRIKEYFGYKPADSHLTKKEVAVGELMYKYMHMFRYNLHIMFELPHIKMAHGIGTALYPTLTLFNHSCDPSVTRYYIKDTLVLRSIKPIKAGDIVYDTYGCVLYWDNTRQERIDALLSTCHFTCKCQACEENWPLASQMSQEVVPLLCECGGVIHCSPEKENSWLCPKCKNTDVSLSILTKLMNLAPNLLKANDVFGAGHFEDAMKMCGNILDKQYKYLVPPYFDIVKVQKRLEDCIHHLGNKRFDYKFVYEWDYTPDPSKLS